jgi:AcrR family transcriptional regulator
MSSRAPVNRRPGRPRATESLDTRQRIIDAARRVFAARGYDAATSRDLGAEAGITAGSIYYHFDSKFDLYVAVHAYVQTLVFGRFEAAIERADRFRDKFESLLEEAHNLNREDSSLARFLASARADTNRNAELRVALAPSARARQQFFDRLIAVGVETGEIDPADRQTVEAAITTILVGLNDVMSDTRSEHRRAINGIKALMEGTLISRAS